MPDTMQCPAEVSQERTALKRENKALREKLTATRTALEAVQDHLAGRPMTAHGPTGRTVQLITYTLSTTQP